MIDMLMKKLVVSTAVSSVMVAGGAGSLLAERASDHSLQRPWINQQEQQEMIELRALNDLQVDDDIEVIIESRGDWPAEENNVCGKRVGPRETTTLFSIDNPTQSSNLLSYRFQGTLYQLDMNEFLNESKTIKLSDFVPQAEDNYEYGKPHVCTPQSQQDINQWREHPENIPWGNCEEEDGIGMEMTFGIQNGEVYEASQFEMPQTEELQKLVRVSNDSQSEASIKVKIIKGNQIVEEFIIRPDETKLSNGVNQPGNYRVELEKIGHGKCDGKIADANFYQR